MKSISSTTLESVSRYKSLSQLTDPKVQARMLDKLPSDIDGICRIAKNQTMHHNLLGFYRISEAERDQMIRVKPPRFDNVLAALSMREPFDLYHDRQPAQRALGACFLESHLLAGMLRHKGFPARVRAGYFKDVQTNLNFIMEFWENALQARGVDEELRNRDPDQWKRRVDEFATKQVLDNHHIEHFVCEYWEEQNHGWSILDANNTFLKALSDIDVPFQLPRTYYEFAHEAWKEMRSNSSFNDDRYAEEPRDGRSHIRYQLLLDFFSQLNHDSTSLRNNSEPSSQPDFIRERTYGQLSDIELEELDALAALLSQERNIQELVELYERSETLHYVTAERDPYSFVSVK